MRWSWNTLTCTNSWISAAMVIISPLFVVNVRTRSVTMEGRFVKRNGKSGTRFVRGAAGSMRAVTG